LRLVVFDEHMKWPVYLAFLPDDDGAQERGPWFTAYVTGGEYRTQENPNPNPK
jgi:hypothetical protein